MQTTKENPRCQCGQEIEPGKWLQHYGSAHPGAFNPKKPVKKFKVKVTAT